VTQGIAPCGEHGIICGRLNGNAGAAYVEAGKEKALHHVKHHEIERVDTYIYAFVYTYAAYLIDSVPVGSQGLVAEIITLEDTTGEQARSSLGHISSNGFLGEGHCPGIMAERAF
jgi:hypothetical protein